MSFNDEDLARLKGNIARSDRSENIGGWFLNFTEWDALLARLEAAEAVALYLDHEVGCILNSRCAGEPTPDGGYREKYGDKWYQTRPIDETPKCDCGLDELYQVWRKKAGK